MKQKIIASSLLLTFILCGCEFENPIKIPENNQTQSTATDTNVSKASDNANEQKQDAKNKDQTDKTRYFIVSYLYTENNTLTTDQVFTYRKDGTFPSKAELSEYIIENSGDNAKNIVPINIQELSQNDFEQYTSGLKKEKTKR